MNSGEGLLRRNVSAVVSALGLLLAAAAHAELPETMLSAEEATRSVPAGAWQGEWRVTRSDPRLITRASSELLVLTVFHDQGAAKAGVTWLAGRAICEDPLAEPCETVGASGDAVTAAINAGALLAVLRVSPDEADPYLLHLAAPLKNRPAQGVLLNARGDWAYRIEAERLVESISPTRTQP